MILFSETCFKCKFGVCSQSVRQLYKTTTCCTSWGSIFLSIGFCNVLRYVIKRYTHIKSGALITWIGKVSLKIFLKADIFGVDALDKSFMPNGFSVAVTRSFSTLLSHCRLGLAVSFSYLKALRSVVRYKFWLFHYRNRNRWFLGLIYRSQILTLNKKIQLERSCHWI